MNSILETETQTEAISNTNRRSHCAKRKRNYEKKNTYNMKVNALAWESPDDCFWNGSIVLS